MEQLKPRAEFKQALGERPMNYDAIAPEGVVALKPVGDLPRPTKDMQRAKQDLEQSGYALLERVLPDATVSLLHDLLLAEAVRDDAENPDTVKGIYSFSSEKSYIVKDLPRRHRMFRDLLEHPAALEFADYLLGPSYLGESNLVHDFSGIIQMPGAKAQGIHADQDYVRPYVDLPLQLRFMWVLCDFTEEIGATRMIPGSHRFGRMPDKSGKLRYESVAAEAPAGSMLVWDNRTYHAAGANRTDRPRPILAGGYVPPWIRPQANFPMIIEPREMIGASPTLRRLLGYNSVAVGFDHSWSAAPADVLSVLCPPGAM